MVLTLAMPTSGSPGRFVDAEETWKSMATGVTLLDARPAADYRAGHIEGARNVQWDDFSERSRAAFKGRLDDDDARLGRLLGQLGVRHGLPVIVYGAPLEGWGEEGRVAWMLEALGHDDVHILDGGVDAWTGSGGGLVSEVPAPAEGPFEVRRRGAIAASTGEVEAALDDPSTLLLDTRAREEFDGAHRYGVARGGRIPRSRWLHWKELLDEKGRLLPAAQVRAKVRALSGDGKAPRRVIAYCVGGVRSGFAYWALREAGFEDAANYGGSFWEWSAREDLPVER